MTPQQYKRFTIFRKLPAGGMGRVYEANDPMFGRRVALKLIDRGSDADSLQIVAAERLGAELQKRLCAVDQRITAVLEYGEDSEYFYIVMEYIDGQDLSELSGRERIGYPFAARIAQDVLNVLHHAHSFRTSIDGREYQGIVHGDIKPRNIRLTTVGQVKVLDFGIAKALSMTRSFTQNVFGSVQYSSPERLNTGEVTISSDLWSVGVVLFELVARRPYFEPENGTRLEHTIRSYRELRPIPDDCPAPLHHILARALAPDPSARYQSAEEFANDIREFRDAAIRGSLEDSEATRRVGSVQAPEAETRRTVPTEEATSRLPADDLPTDDIEATRFTGVSARQPPPPPATPAPRAITLPPSAVIPKRRRGLRWARIALLFVLAVLGATTYLVLHEYFIWQDARRFARDLETERLDRLDVAWQKYQAIASRGASSWALWSAQDALRDRLVADAERAINSYRASDSPAVSETEWVRARTSLARALELAPSDKRVKGDLRLVDGHIARIRGSARKDARLLDDARENFTEAANLLPKSPDPWLGLSRLYVYSLHDVDKGEDALREAERRNHEIGKRETAQLADGYRDRAERTMRESDRASSREEAERYLELARKDFERARQLYESITPWGGVPANLRRTNDALERIEVKKTELSAGGK